MCAHLARLLFGEMYVRESDEAEVLIWRVARLRELGFSPDMAIELAEEQIDYRELAKLLASGCPPETAVEILR